MDLLICLFSPDAQRLSDRLFEFKVVVIEKFESNKTSFIQLTAALAASLVLAVFVHNGPSNLRLDAPWDDYKGLVGIDRLAAASEKADIEEMEKLLRGTSANKVDKHGRLPLEWSCPVNSGPSLYLNPLPFRK